MQFLGNIKQINRKLIISTLIVLITLFANVRVLDNYVDNYVNESIKNAAISYATARGINAVVSVLQTSTIEAGVFISGSASIGELLDPVNDLIERFSTIMTFVLGSLVAQKILLLMSSHDFFNYLILVVGLTSILALHYRSQRESRMVIKLFVLVIFIRFALGLIVALNSSVDHVFLLDETVKYENEIKKFSNDINLSDVTSNASDIGFFKNLESKVEGSVSSFMNLMMVFILKSIVFPLLFFYGFVLGIKGIWKSKFLLHFE